MKAIHSEPRLWMQLNSHFHTHPALPLAKGPHSQSFIEFCLSNSGTVGSNPSQGILFCLFILYVCVCVCVFVFSCVGRRLEISKSPV